MRHTTTACLIAALAAATASVLAGAARRPAADDDTEFFEAKVRPILVARCQSCHGAPRQSAGLRLDSAAAVQRGAASGPLGAKDPAESRLVRAISYTGPVKMPPSGRLPDDEITVLTEWVRRGLPWGRELGAVSLAQTGGARGNPGGGIRDQGEARSGSLHPSSLIPHPSTFWSFQPVRQPAVPAVPAAYRSWVRNPIDAFVLRRLLKAGLRPAPAGDRRTLIRRVTYDLTGLPPTPAEVRAFVADRSPDAWARVVDRLLASPRYGERWGRHWLDVVRYCDSLDARGVGSEGDVAFAWRYRDWVIEALNRDMPYDQFVMNQIAGDLLPPADAHAGINVPGTIATGFLAVGNWGNGDADKDKILTDIADDQVDAVSRGFMGLTVACARCHDHKFDPVTQTDYYGLAGVFFSTHILPKLTPKGQGENLLRIPLETAETAAARVRDARELKDAEAAADQERQAAYSANARDLLSRTAAYLTAYWQWRHAAPGAGSTLARVAAARGLQLYALRQWGELLDQPDLRLFTVPVNGVLGNAGVDAWKGSEDTPSVTVNANDAARSILTFTLPPHSVCVHPGPKSGVATVWVSPVDATVRVEGGVADADPACGDGVAWSVRHVGASGAEEIASGDFPNGGMQLFAAGAHADRLGVIRVRPGDRLELVVLPKATHICDTTVVHLVIARTDGSERWDLANDVIGSLHSGGNPHPDSYGHAGVWEFGESVDAEQARPGDAAARPIDALRRALADAATSDTAAAAAEMFARGYADSGPSSPFWIRNRADEEALPVATRTRLAQLDADLAKKRAAAPPPVEYANGAQEGGVPESPHAGVHDVRVHIRGSYARLGDMVPRHFPVVLAGDHHPAITHGSGRLELARWIASPSHPLTARVIVNRVWQHHFGEGIVRTPSNFGFLGERPTHPELLDWLAAAFVEGAAGANQEVTQIANRESQIANREWALGWSLKKLHRLILLSSTYQQASEADARTLLLDPDDRLLSRMPRLRLEAEEVRDSLLAAARRLDTTMGGPAVRDFTAPRRTVYLMTIRSDRSGFGPLFDMADSTAQVDRRTVSIVAPQALYLLNDAFVLTQVKALARSLLEEVAADDRARIALAYQRLFARPVAPAEVRIGLAFLARARRQRTARVAGSGAPDVELAAWTAYCQILVCSNEFMFVD